MMSSMNPVLRNEFLFHFDCTPAIISVVYVHSVVYFFLSDPLTNHLENKIKTVNYTRSPWFCLQSNPFCQYKDWEMTYETP